MGILHIQIHHKLYCSFRTFAFCSPPFSIFIALLKKLLILAHFVFSQVTQKLICQKLCIDIGKIHAQLLYLLQTSLPAIENKLVELHQRQLELLALATSAGAESTEFDEEMNRVTKERLSLIAKRTELEKNHIGTVDIDCRLDIIMKSLETVSGNILTFDDISVRQVVSDIKVLGKEKLLVRFKDGTEIEQIVGVFFFVMMVFLDHY